MMDGSSGTMALAECPILLLMDVCTVSRSDTYTLITSFPSIFHFSHVPRGQWELGLSRGRGGYGKTGRGLIMVR